MRSTRPASCKGGRRTKPVRCCVTSKLLSTLALTHLEINPLVCLTDVGQPSKDVLLLAQRVTQHHEQPTNDREVAQEEVDIEDEAIAESLDDDDAKEGTY